MSRRKRSGKEFGCCYHVTHRCQETRPLLRFEKDRKNYVERLRQCVRRYPVEVLNYMVTSNHIHLLLWSETPEALTQAMQFLEGSAAQDYNRRKERNGAFWTGRYHTTLIEDGHHLGRCLFYIDLNMVRAQAVKHPSEWRQCGHQELIGNKQRKLIIRQERLRRCLQMTDHQPDEFRTWYKVTLQEKLTSTYHVREPYWSEAFAVGSEDWVKKLAAPMPRKSYSIEQVAQPNVAREEPATYVLKVSPRKQSSYLKALSRQ